MGVFHGETRWCRRVCCQHSSMHGQPEEAFGLEEELPSRSFNDTIAFPLCFRISV